MAALAQAGGAPPRRAAAGTAARRNPVHEYVGHSNGEPACTRSAKTSGSSATRTLRPPGNRPAGARPTGIRPGDPLDLAGGKWLLNPGAVGAPIPPRAGWWDGLDRQAADGAFWVLLDLDRRTATWRRAPYDPAPPSADAPARSGSTTTRATQGQRPAARCVQPARAHRRRTQAPLSPGAGRPAEAAAIASVGQSARLSGHRARAPTGSTAWTDLLGASAAQSAVATDAPRGRRSGGVLRSRPGSPPPGEPG